MSSINLNFNSIMLDFLSKDIQYQFDLNLLSDSNVSYMASPLINGFEKEDIIFKISLRNSNVYKDMLKITIKLDSKNKLSLQENKKNFTYELYVGNKNDLQENSGLKFSYFKDLDLLSTKKTTCEVTTFKTGKSKIYSTRLVYCLSKSKLKEYKLPSLDGKDNFSIILGLRITYLLKEKFISIYNDLKKKFVYSILYDVQFIIKIKGLEYFFNAHSFILKQKSKIFAEILKFKCEGNNKKSRINVIEVGDIEPTTFEYFLYYLYTGKIRDDYFESQVIKVMKLAHKYAIESLTHICITRLLEQLCEENLIEMFLLSDVYNLRILKSAVIMEIKKQFNYHNVNFIKECEDRLSEELFSDILKETKSEKNLADKTNVLLSSKVNNKTKKRKRTETIVIDDE